MKVKFFNIFRVIRKFPIGELIGYVFGILYNLKLRIVGNLSFKCKARLLNIKYGNRVKIFGKLILSKYPGSTIKIGDDFFSNSDSFRSSASTLFSFTRLKTMSTESEIIIGNNVGLNGTSITSRSKSIKISNNVMIAANVIIMDSDFHVLWPPEDRLINPGLEFDQNVSIEENVWIGTNCTILKGVTIGKNSVIAAGSVVAHSIPANVLAAGVPAKVIKNLLNENRK